MSISRAPASHSNSRGDSPRVPILISRILAIGPNKGGKEGIVRWLADALHHAEAVSPSATVLAPEAGEVPGPDSSRGKPSTSAGGDQAAFALCPIVDVSPGKHVDEQMLVAAAEADVALIVVDACAGMDELAHRTAHLCSLFGIRHFVVVANKMDKLGYCPSKFGQLAAQWEQFAERLKLASLVCLPVCARTGENILTASPKLDWFEGPSLLQAVTNLPTKSCAKHLAEAPPGDQTDSQPQVADQFRATVVWLHPAPMLPGRPYTFRLGGRTTGAALEEPRYKVNVDTLEQLAARTLDRDDVGVCNVHLDEAVAYTAFADNQAMGRFTLADRTTGEVVGVGILEYALWRSANVRWQSLDVDKVARAAIKGQKPCVVWFTGLSGSGKSTIANLLEKRLHAEGVHTYLLDGDNVRHGLNKDLGFTDADRVENIRRISEVAKLMVDAGLIVLVSFISPFRAERKMAREALAEGEFLEVFIDTPLAEAELRDPKGLYAKARQGMIKNFTGIDSPYEPPLQPEVHIQTQQCSAEAASELLLSHLLPRRSEVAH